MRNWPYLVDRLVSIDLSLLVYVGNPVWTLVAWFFLCVVLSLRQLNLPSGQVVLN